MKNRFYRTSFKAAAVVVSALVLLSSVFCVLAGILMVKNDFYTRTEQSVFQEVSGYLLDHCNSTVFYEVMEGKEPSLDAYESGNYLFQIQDEQGTVIAGNYTGQSVQVQEKTSLYWEEYLSYEEGYQARTYTVTGYLSSELTGPDMFTVTGRLVHFFYSARYGIFFWLFLSLLLEVALWIYLFCSAGNHPGEASPRLNPVDRIPFDLATVFLYLFVCVQYAVIMGCGDLATRALLCFFFLLDYLLLLWYFLSMASRLKVGGLLRRTLVGRFVLWMREMLSVLFVHLPVLWKTVVMVGIVTLLELVLFMSNLWEPDNLILLWIIERLIFIPVVFWIALSLHRLKKGGERLAEGRLEERLDTGNLIGEFKRFGESLNSIGEGMNKAVEERMKSERFKTELITNVSHDIKTPLTSIINYVDLLKKEETENEAVRQYLEVLDRQSARLKKLIEDLVEASKASTGNLTVRAERCDAGVLLTQMVGEFDRRFRERGLEPILRLPEEPVAIWADPRHLWRILDNLMVNIWKYAQTGTRVYLDLLWQNGETVLVFRNISKEPIRVSGEELAERFVRGDRSRNTEGSGLGLSIARSLAELQGGTLEIQVDGDLFKALLRFPGTEDAS